MKKHEEATYEEARLALEECDESLRKLEDGNTEENGDSVKVTGKRTFGPAEDTNKVTNKKQKLDDGDKNSDSEYESDSAQHLDDNEPQDDLFKVRILSNLLLYHIIFAEPECDLLSVELR
jgi:U3 small nucleolar RNA-associated protein 14